MVGGFVGVRGSEGNCLGMGGKGGLSMLRGPLGPQALDTTTLIRDAGRSDQRRGNPIVVLEPERASCGSAQVQCALWPQGMALVSQCLLVHILVCENRVFVQSSWFQPGGFNGL